MNKKAIIAVLSALVLTVVASVSLILTVGQKASAHTEHGRILVLSDWDDFYIDGDPGAGDWYATYWGISPEIGENLLGYSYDGCGYFWGNGNGKLDEYDEIHLIIPEGVTDMYGYYSYGDDENKNFDEKFLGKVTYVKIPSSVTKLDWQTFAYMKNLKSIVIPSSVSSITGQGVFEACENLTIYCEVDSRPSGWDDEWNDGSYYFYNETGDWVKKSVELRVVWDCNKTIEFDVNGGNETFEDQVVCVDSLVTKPTDPTKEGYTFKGWYNGDDEYDFTTPVTANMTLTAKWEAVQAQPEPTEPETPADENAKVNNQNNAGLIWGIAGTSGAALIIAGVVVGIVIAKRRRK